MKKEQLLLFDVDGVIVDSFDGNYLAAKAFIAQNSGPDISEEEYRSLLEGNAWKNVFQKAGLELKDEFTEEDVGAFFSTYPENPIFPEMKSVIEEVAKSHILVINTSTFISFASQIFEREGIQELFAAFLGPKSSVQKDDKIRMAMEEFGKTPEETIFITDTAGDIAEAKETGVKTIGVTWGYHKRGRMEEAKPDLIVDSPKELLDALTK